MLILLAWIATLNDNNAYSLAQKLALLTTPNANVFVLVTILLNNVYNWVGLFFSFCSIWLFMAVLPTLSLTNTLFTIHPIMLYIAIIFTLRSVHRRPLERGFYAQGALFALAIILGGVWSMQELNWGGWWNWDVLELGIAQIWVISWLSSHISRQKSIKILDLKYGAMFFCTLTYYCLNKSGIAVSIHSFITSKSLRLNTQMIVTLYCAMLLNTCSRLNLLGLFVLIIVYGKIVAANALKICTLFITIVALNRFYSFKGKLAVYHFIFLNIVVIVTAINYTNMGVSVTKRCRSQAALMSLFARPLTTNNSHIFIWDGKWLSKPNPRFSGMFNFYQMRSQRYTITTLTYKK